MQTDAPAAVQALRLAAGAEGSATFDVRAVSESGVPDCPGYVDPSAPDVVLDWGGGDLRFWVRAGFDATLLVAGPDGEWTCNDDAEGTSPVVDLTNAEAGRYAVWLGSFSPDAYEPEATLYAGAPPPPPVLDPTAAPVSGTVEAVAGFEEAQGAIEINVQAGGGDRAAALDLDPSLFCTGFIDAAQPTALIDYTASDGPGTLVIAAYAMEGDLVLLVSGPEGEVWCNDDVYGSDPAIEVADAESGAYAVWVGTYGAQLETAPATLTFSETELMMGDEGFDDYSFDEPGMGGPFGEGTYGVLDLSASPSALVLEGDETSADLVISPTMLNPIQGGLCSGLVEERPTVSVTVEGDGPVAITASGEVDLVMILRTPSGTWYCSDDAYNLDPGVQIDEPEAGAYLVWAGSYGDLGEPFDVTVRAARGELEVSERSVGPEPVGVDPQSEGTYDGTEIRAGQAALTLDLGETASVRAGGPILNPVVGTACSGFVSERPTASFTASGPVRVSASADADLTLLVQAPGGAWYCSDDADGTDPRIDVPESAEGAFSVWVGTFSRLTAPPDAELSLFREVGTGGE